MAKRTTQSKERVATTTLDTTIVRKRSAREYLTAWLEHLGHTLVLTPEVAIEAQRQVPASETEAWMKRLRKAREAGRNITRSEELRLIGATHQACRTWWQDEVENHRTTIRAIQPTEAEEGAAFDLAQRLPGHWFTETEPVGDRKIIAECIVHGFTLIAAVNRNTIDHAEVNAWAHTRTPHHDDLIVSPEQALQRWPAPKRGERAAIALALWSPHGTEPLEQDAHDTIARACRWLTASELSETAGDIEREWVFHKDEVLARLEDIRVPNARAMRQRHIEAARDAAASTD